ncbi:Ig domain-containing protein [Enterococcus sp. DIV0242_7C1]|uniref:Uncharacterized protein n=1 Tax=Candidatus Enterococcus dunnyi TaxID=1834192 RepID=A0A200IZE9_9ENTE|nr:MULTISPECIES: Ig domain-containing protein [unclassified Enterococcus]MBO0469918.1 Ig domain-containing protein [Enterococcus sp. DIV0242_7C1]OUZ30354.1 hypothetical protein A5889_002642 [Enterococcus sp. 9D6_DIV0238]
MKKISLLLLGVSFSLSLIGGTTTAKATEKITTEPYGEIQSVDILSSNDSEINEAFVPKERAALSAGVTYRTHVQDIGWQGWKSNAQVSGTSGQKKRLEAIQLKVQNSPYSGDIEYRTHVQDIGWQTWKKNGQSSGTSGQKKRLEAIQIKLTGQLGQVYDVFYRVHAQEFGWMGWEKGGIPSGTSKYSYRLEAIEVKLVPKKSYTRIDYMGKMSYRDNRTFTGEINYQSVGVPKSMLSNSLKLFKDAKSINAYIERELKDVNRKAIACQTYVIKKGLTTVGYTAEFYFPY